MAGNKGLFVATLTPFDGANRVDYGVVRAHMDFVIAGGVAGICPVGTTGEFLYLSLGEKARLIEEVVRAVGGRVPVIAGIWALQQREIALLARAAHDVGADAAFLPPPIYYPASEASVYSHYLQARDAGPVPVFAYNIPAYAGNTVTTACADRMAKDGVIVGIKDSSGKADRMLELVAALGSRIPVMAASDSFATEGRKLGADGFISAIANIFPQSLVKLWAGDESLQPAVDAVRTAIKKAGGIPGTKYLATRRGFAFGSSRLPEPVLTAEQTMALDAAYDAALSAGLQ